MCQEFTSCHTTMALVKEKVLWITSAVSVCPGLRISVYQCQGPLTSKRWTYHIMVPHYHVYSFHVACLGERATLSQELYNITHEYTVNHLQTPMKYVHSLNKKIQISV